MPASNPLLRRLFKIILILPVLLLVSGNLTSSASTAESKDGQSDLIYLPLAYYGDLDLFISGVKVIQGTTMSNKYKVYIADRATIVRVFVGVNGGSKVVGVTGELCGYNQNGAPLGCLPPDNKSITAPSYEPNLKRTLNFTPPDDWLKKGYSYHVEINKDHHIAERDRDNNRFPVEGTRQFNFKNTPALDVVVVPIVYQPYGSSKEYYPKMDNYDYLTEYPEKLFPIPAANYQFHNLYPYRPGNERYNLDKKEGWLELLSKVESLQNLEDPSGTLIYYGLVNSFDAHGCANGCTVGVANQGSRGAAGWSGLGTGTIEGSKTMTHEIGHNFNRKHILCDGSEDNIDKNYPYPGGSIGVWGLDIEERKLIDPDSYFDFMSYCQDIWTSDYTYWNIFQFRASNLLKVSKVPFEKKAMYIRGMVTPDGEVTILPVYRQIIASISTVKGPYEVDLLDNLGQVLGTFNFEMIDIADASGYRHFGFFAPSIPGTAGLRLREGERILVEKTILSGFDHLKSLEKQLVIDSVGNRLQVSWLEVSHPEELVYYQVRLSKDGGSSWQILALDWRESTILLPELSGNERGRSLLEIQASDGIHTRTQIFDLRLDR